MVNALFDHSSSGTSGSSSDAIQVSGDVASLSTEEFDIIDTSDSGIVMSVSRTNGVDINADTTIHTPLNTQIPLMITDSNNNVVVRVNQDSTIQSVDATIARSVFSLLSGANLYTGANKLLMSTVPTGYTVANMRYFRSRLQLGVHFNFYNPTYYPTSTPTQFITLQGGLKGNTTGETTYGELCIQDVGNNTVSDTTKSGEQVVLHLTYASSGVALTPKEAVLGIHTTNPQACVHIQNRGASMTPFRVDNASGTSIMSIDNSGNLTVSGTVSGTNVGSTGSQSFTNSSSSAKILTLKSSTGSERLTVADDSSITLTSAVANPGSVTLTAGTTSNNFNYSSISIY